MPLNEKIDVFSLANNIYSIVTGLYPYHAFTADEAKERVAQGLRPDVDPRWRQRSFAERKLLELVDWCWEYQANKRPDIFQVVAFLETAVEENNRRYLQEDERVYVPLYEDIVDKGDAVRRARWERDAKRLEHRETEDKHPAGIDATRKIHRGKKEIF